MIRLVIFDLDETVVINRVPFYEMRERILEEVGVSADPPHLYEFLRSMGPQYIRILEREEIRRAQNSYVHPAFDGILDFLRGRGVKIAILTRNSRKAAETALGDYINRIDALVTRDDPFPPKPSPEPVIYLMRRFSSSPPETVVVGDYDYDVQAGRAAGCITVRIGSGDADYVIGDLSEILPLFDTLFGEW